MNSFPISEVVEFLKSQEWERCSNFSAEDIKSGNVGAIHQAIFPLTFWHNFISSDSILSATKAPWNQRLWLLIYFHCCTFDNVSNVSPSIQEVFRVASYFLVLLTFVGSLNSLCPRLMALMYWNDVIIQVYYNYLLEFNFSEDLILTDVANFDILQGVGKWTSNTVTNF